MNEKILEEKELSKLVIDLVWSATDGGCKLKESDFSHFEEPSYEWTALVSKFSTSINQARTEERERVMELIKSRKPNEHAVREYKTVEARTWDEKNLVIEALDDLLASLDNPK